MGQPNLPRWTPGRIHPRCLGHVPAGTGRRIHFLLVHQHPLRCPHRRPRRRIQPRERLRHPIPTASFHYGSPRSSFGGRGQRLCHARNHEVLADPTAGRIETRDSHHRTTFFRGGSPRIIRPRGSSNHHHFHHGPHRILALPLSENIQKRREPSAGRLGLERRNNHFRLLCPGAHGLPSIGRRGTGANKPRQDSRGIPAVLTLPPFQVSIFISDCRSNEERSETSRWELALDGGIPCLANGTRSLGPSLERLKRANGRKLSIPSRGSGFRKTHASQGIHEGSKISCPRGHHGRPWIRQCLFLCPKKNPRKEAYSSFL